MGARLPPSEQSTAREPACAAGAILPDMSNFSAFVSSGGYEFTTSQHASFALAIRNVDVLISENYPYGETFEGCRTTMGFGNTAWADLPRAFQTGHVYALDGTMDSRGPPYGGSDWCVCCARVCGSQSVRGLCPYPTLTEPSLCWALLVRASLGRTALVDPPEFSRRTSPAAPPRPAPRSHPLPAVQVRASHRRARCLPRGPDQRHWRQHDGAALLPPSSAERHGQQRHCLPVHRRRRCAAPSTHDDLQRDQRCHVVRAAGPAPRN